jgi:hypothetical protein
MLTHPANALAEILEVDKSTMLKALRSTPPDLTRKGNRPTWRVGTASKALLAYKQRLADEKRRKEEAKNGGTERVNTELQGMFDQLMAADAEMRAIGSLAGRRAFAKKTLLPLLRQVDRVMRDDARANGEPEMVTGLRCDEHLRLFVVAGLGPDATNGCDWTPSQAWDAYEAGHEDDEAA